MYISKRKILVPIAVLASVFFCIFSTVDAYALFSINPTVRTGYTVNVDGETSDVKYIATYGGTAYVPLNYLAHDLGMKYSMTGNVAAFSYEDTLMIVDYGNNSVTVDGAAYNLQFGTVRKTIGGQQYLFFNVKDIQNVFGIIASYDEEMEEIKLNTGFGVLDLSYDLGINAVSETVAKQKLMDYAKNISNQTGCVLSENNAKAYGSLSSLFNSLNTPISKKEYVSGISISNVNTETTSVEDIRHLMNLKLLVGLSKLTVVPEYFGCYELTNSQTSMQVVGAFYSVDGIEISNTDLGVSAVATIEDVFGSTLSPDAAKEIQSTIAASASSARSIQHYIIAVIQGGKIKVVDVF